MKVTSAALLVLLTACASMSRPKSTVETHVAPGSGVAQVFVEIDNARLPGVEVTFQSSAGVCTEITSITGEVAAPLSPATWTMSAVLPGFVTAKRTFVLASDQDINIQVQLAAKRIESVTIYEPPPTILDPGVFSLTQREIQLLPIQ